MRAFYIAALLAGSVAPPLQAAGAAAFPPPATQTHHPRCVPMRAPSGAGDHHAVGGTPGERGPGVDVGFLEVASAWLLAVGGLVVWQVYYLKMKYPSILRKWADDNGWRLVRHELAGRLGKASFGPKGILEVTVYRVEILDEQGKRRQGFVRVGDPWLGPFVPSTEIAVQWDGSPPS